MTPPENCVKYGFAVAAEDKEPILAMIETTIPEINVVDLMARVRAKANELRCIQARPKLPEIADVAEPAAAVLPKPVALKRDQLLGATKSARGALTVARWIPKALRGLFRHQSRFNRDLLRAVETLVGTNTQVGDRLQHLTACIAVQDHTLRHLAHLRRQDGEWMTAAGQVITDLHDKLLEARTQTNSDVATRIDEISGAIKALERDFAALQSNRDLLLKTQQDLAAEFRAARDQEQRATEQIGQITDNLGIATKSLQQLREETAASTQRLSVLEDAGTRLEKELAAGGIAFPVDRLAKLENDLPLDIRGLREVLERAGEHLRNLQSQVDRETIQQQRFHELEEIVARLEQRMTDDGSYLKAEVAQHRAVLARLSEPGPTSRQRIKPAPSRGLLDAFYLTFEDRFRGARPDIKQRLKFYLPFIRKAGAGSTEFPVLDVGCGRGEWLELLKENDLAAKGVDLNATMQAQCAERGLDVAHADALDYLRALPDGQLGALTGFHIIEHLPLETLLDLVSHTYRVLRPGGVVIFESPNCKNLVVGACTFYLDPTHRNPIVPETAQFILASHGFVKSEINYLSPIKGSPFRSKSASAKLLDAYFFGPQDFSVVGFKTPLK